MTLGKPILLLATAGLAVLAANLVTPDAASVQLCDGETTLSLTELPTTMPSDA